MLKIIDPPRRRDRPIYSARQSEECIFKREGIRVVWLVFDQTARAWTDYTYDRAVGKNQSVAVFRERLEQYAPGAQYIIIDGHGQTVVGDNQIVGAIRDSYR